MQDKTLGQKIKSYREKIKMSQFQLEIEIEASSGSISRIENDLVRPTKETLSKIASALKLKPSEIADLLGLKIFSPEELIIAINTLSKCLDLETTLQTAVDIMFDLYPGYNGGVVFLVDTKNKDLICSKTVSNMPNVEAVHRLLPKKITEYSLPITEDKGNFVALTAKNKTNYQSFDIANFSKGQAPDIITRNIGKILGFEVGITIPLRFEDEIIGATLYTKRIRENFTDDEQRVLGLLNDQLAIAIKKAEMFSEIKKDMDELKNKINKVLYS